MKNSFSLIKHKVSSAVKTHFDKNPNDIVALTFGASVLAFILLFTPYIPQVTDNNSVDQPSVKQESLQQINTDMIDGTLKNEDKTALKANLK